MNAHFKVSVCLLVCAIALFFILGVYQFLSYFFLFGGLVAFCLGLYDNHEKKGVKA